MGYCPDWYPLFVAAKYLGVAPWDLLEQPIAYRTWALQSRQAEVESQKQRAAFNERKGF